AEPRSPPARPFPHRSCFGPPGRTERDTHCRGHATFAAGARRRATDPARPACRDRPLRVTFPTTLNEQPLSSAIDALPHTSRDPFRPGRRAPDVADRRFRLMPPTPTSRGRRAPGRAVVALALAAILVATLVPTGHDPETTPLLCLVCGGKGLADGLSNILLFAPFGLGLALLGVRPRRAILAGAALSLCIEFTQQFIPGRDPSLSDLVFNTAGTALGVLVLRAAPRLLAPPASLASRLALAAAAVAAGVLGVTASSFTPAFPDSAYYAQWTPDLGHLARYDGQVLAA